MAVTRTETWLRCRLENGPAASEPRRRSEWLLHGPDPTRIQPNTRSRRDALRLMAGAPRGVPIVRLTLSTVRPPLTRGGRSGAHCGEGAAIQGVEGKGGWRGTKKVGEKTPNKSPVW